MITDEDFRGLWQFRPGIFFGIVASWIRAQFAAEREQWILWSPVALGTGVAAYFLLLSEPPGWTGGVMLVLSCIALAGMWRAKGGGALLFAFSIALTCFAAGFSAAQLRTFLVAAPVLEKRTGPVALEGGVVSVQPHDKGWRMVLENPAIGRMEGGEAPEKVRVTLRGEPPGAVAGDRVRLRAVVMPPPQPAAPGSFDFQRHVYFKGIGAVGYGLGRVQQLNTAQDGENTFAVRLSNLRSRLSARIRESTGNRADETGTVSPAGAIASALLTGERGAIPGDVIDAMRDSGLAHLLAISGLHMGLVTGILFFACRGLLALIPSLALHYPIKKWAALAALLGAFAYLLITGATIPTQRAFIMTGLVLVAVLADRTAISLRMVAWAAAIILLLSPESLLGPSFQMSFAAVVALVAVYEGLRDRLPRWRAKTDERGNWWRIPSLYVGGVALTTLVASLATAPFAIYQFNRFALFGLAANLVAVPLTALWIMPWGVLAFLLMPLGLEQIALTPMGWGIEMVVGIAGMVSGWPGAAVLVPSMPQWGLTLVVFGGLWLCLWRRRWRLLGAPVLILGLLSLFAADPPHILISGDGKLAAVRAESGQWLLSSGRKARWTATSWLRMTGQEESSLWPDHGQSPGGRLSCDGLGCLYRAEGKTVALVSREDAFDEDCAVAQLVLATVPLRGACDGPWRVIDRFDLWRNGAYGVWLGGEKIRVENVRQSRGMRTWVQHPRGGQGGFRNCGPKKNQEKKGWALRLELILAHQSHDTALDPDPVGAENTGFKILVGGLQGDGRALAANPFQGHFLVIDQGHHDGAVLGAVAVFYEGGIAIEDSRLDHGIAIHLKGVVFTAAEQAGRNRHPVRFVAQGLDGVACGNGAVKGQFNGLHLVGGDRAGEGFKIAVDHLGVETGATYVPSHVSGGGRGSGDISGHFENFQGAGAVGQAADKTALLKPGDEAVNARLGFQPQGILHFVVGGGNAGLFQAFVDEHQQFVLFLREHE